MALVTSHMSEALCWPGHKRVKTMAQPPKEADMTQLSPHSELEGEWVLRQAWGGGLGAGEGWYRDVLSVA